MRLALGLLLLPTAAVSFLAAAKALGSIASHPRTTLDFLYGFLGYAILHFLFFKPLRIYVFAHELTHALAAWLGGVAVYGFHVGKQEGKVELSSSNTFIALAPYCIPLYALAVVVGYRVFLWYAGQSVPSPSSPSLFLVVMGAALAFHILMTADTFWGRRQPDLLQAGGMVFSLSIIAIANSLLLIVALKIFFPSLVSVARGATDILQGTLAFWGPIIGAVRAFLDWFGHASS